MRRLRLTATAATGICGFVLLAQGLWIPAKAMVAQVLLQRAWAQTVYADSAIPSARIHRPWPWADTWPVARLQAPAHDVDLIVLHGASGEALAFGPGWIEGLDELSPVALAGHRDTHFAFLGDLEAGDELLLDLPADLTNHESRRYRVTEAFRVDHRDTSALRGDADDLVLVTCWPLDAVTPGPWRWIVRARSVGG